MPMIELMQQMGVMAFIIVAFGAFFGLIAIVVETIMVINNWYEERKYKQLRAKRYLRFNHRK